MHYSLMTNVSKPTQFAAKHYTLCYAVLDKWCSEEPSLMHFSAFIIAFVVH